MSSNSEVSADCLDIYCVAIGGTGMAPLACLLKAMGHRVRGSDTPLYPPMSTLLQDAGIEPLVGFDAAHLDPLPDLFIISNAVPRHNVEAVAVEASGVERLSMPEALYRFFLSKRQPLVVAGTHGKTTTTSIAAWVYDRCGGDPGYLIGGVPKNFESSFHIGTGERFVIEGDEYNAAYFDRGPKFLHYSPQTLILTSVEHDHADLYPQPEDLLATYRQLVRLLPEDGLLIVCGDTEEAREVASSAPCKVVTYGLSQDNDVYPLVPPAAGSSPGNRRPGDHALQDHLLRDIDGQTARLRLTVPGEHNLCNAMAVWIAARYDGYSAAAVSEALEDFRGVKRRLEELGSASGVTVIDDFAHHPTAVEKSLGGLRQAYPDRRLVVLFEPRSLTAGRSFFFSAYCQAFALADEVIIAPAFHRQRLHEDVRLDFAGLVAQLRASGVRSCAVNSLDEVFERAVATLSPGDVVVTMSSGSFEMMPQRLLEHLQQPSAMG